MIFTCYSYGNRKTSNKQVCRFHTSPQCKYIAIFLCCSYYHHPVIVTRCPSCHGSGTVTLDCFKDHQEDPSNGLSSWTFIHSLRTTCRSSDWLSEKLMSLNKLNIIYNCRRDALLKWFTNIYNHKALAIQNMFCLMASRDLISVIRLFINHINHNICYYLKTLYK